MKRILVVGATSAIAEACTRLWAEQGHQFVLAARSTEALLPISNDLLARGAKRVECTAFDALDRASCERLPALASSALGGLDTVLIAHGSLPDQAQCESDANHMHRELELNGLSVLSIAHAAAPLLRESPYGRLAVISSPAGDRGRASNYVYGSAKALVDTYFAGLQHQYAREPLRVVLIKPGFVDTPMTAAFPKGPLWAQPGQIAPAIVRAIEKGQYKRYAPWFWWLIMTLIKHLPNVVFHRTKL